MKTAMVALTLMAAAATLGAQSEVRVGSRVGLSSPSGYDDGGRRDPFVSPVVPKKSAQPSGRPAVGLASLSVTDVIVTGIVRSGKVAVAILQAPDGKSFMAKGQDRLGDAVVKSIDAQGVVFTAEAPDAAGVVHQREVRKTIHVMTGVGR